MAEKRNAQTVAGSLLEWYDRAPKDMQHIILEAVRKLCDEGLRADALEQWYSSVVEAFQQEVLSMGDMTMPDAAREDQFRLSKANWLIFGLPVQVWVADGVGHTELFSRSGDVVWQHQHPDEERAKAGTRPAGINPDGSLAFRSIGPVASLAEYLPILKERLAADIADAQAACGGRYEPPT